MLLQRRHRALYAAFDRFPSRKGSAVHIDRFARTLFEYARGGVLYTIGGPGLPPYQREGEVEIVRFSQTVENMLERSLLFGARLDALLDEQEGSLELCHFRDPWSGFPIVSRPRAYRTVYEVNGLPSVELPYTYPAMPHATLEKIAHLEDECLGRADRIVVPSRVIADCVMTRGVPERKVAVIPNGADVPAPAERPPGAPGRYLLYFGALQPWQGLDDALRAFARLSDLDDLRLVVCSSVHPRRAKPYRRLARRLEIDERVVWRFDVDDREFAGWREHAAVSLAPLKDTARNVEQGCSPLKVIESMAAGVPVVASDLPVVRELMEDRVHGRLVDPERPSELARAVRLLLDYPDERRAMGARARRHVKEHLSWERATDRLRAIYAHAGIGGEGIDEAA
jgi:glycosyltransferase involved in cell wall biosynthesis